MTGLKDASLLRSAALQLAASSPYLPLMKSAASAAKGGPWTFVASAMPSREICESGHSDCPDTGDCFAPPHGGSEPHYSNGATCTNIRAVLD